MSNQKSFPNQNQEFHFGVRINSEKHLGHLYAYTYGGPNIATSIVS